MQNYHRHSCYSNIYMADSSVKNEEYAKRAVELGHKIISSVEHGWQGYYFESFELAKKYGLKFVFGTEAYWVKDRKEKDNTNSHMIILARTEKGRQAINDILSTANEDGYYYRPRIDLELILSLPPDDVFITSACVAFWKYDDIEDIILQLHNHFKSNFMLEIQYHNTASQKAINKRILDISKKHGIEMIIGLDSHYIYPEQSNDRDYILAAKNVHYEDETGWFMDYPDDETVMSRFLNQGVFTKEQIRKAMDNTDICLTFDDYDDVRIFNKDIKLPSLYPDLTQEEKNKKYSKLITKKFKEYMKNVPSERYQEYFDGVKAEVQVYKDTGMVDYPLLDYEIIKRGVEMGGVITATGRGSAPSFFTNTLCGFSKIDRFTSPIKLYPERFISTSRILETKSLPDIDMNVSDQDIFAKAQEEVMGGIDHACPMIAFGTFKKKSAFKLYARAKKMDFDLANTISAQFDGYEEALKNAEDPDEVDIFEFISDEYKEYIENSKIYWGIVSDRKKAPCGYLLYDGSIRKEIGLIKCKSESSTKEYMTCVIDGAIAENYKFLKNDLLKVDVVLLIDKICKRIGIQQPSVNELIEMTRNDKNVWDMYAKGYTIGLNQCDTPSSTKKVMAYKPSNISEGSAFVAAIRPGFKSMYKKFENREYFEYGIKSFDKLMQTEELPVSFLFYQEQIMNTLNYAGFPIDECYGIIKAIAKKHPEKVKPLKEKFINGFKEKIISVENVSDEQANIYANDVWEIINNNCYYSFNASHSLSVFLDSLYSAWQKANYPYEFYEVMLNHYSDKGNKDKVMLIKQEMKKAFGIVEGEYKFGKDNRRFLLDKENHCIYPALLSIKGLSQGFADDIYELAQKKQYESFIDVLDEAKEYKSINNAKIETLIKMDYFSEFGDINRLLFIFNRYDKLSKRKTIKKEELKDLFLTESDVRPFAGKETYTRVEEIDCVKWLLDHDHAHEDITDLLKYKYVEKDGKKEKIPGELSSKKVIKKYNISEEEQIKYAKKIISGEFSDIDMSAMLKEFLKNLNYKPASIVDKIKYQQELYGYIQLTIPNMDDNYYYVQSIDGAYANKNVTLYQLCSGYQLVVKAKKKTLEENPLCIGNIIKVHDMSQEKKWGKNPDGSYYQKDEYEYVLKKYNFVK